MTEFNFKEWADLYQVDPEAFEQRREAVLEGFVSGVDPAHRQSLEQTLFRIRMTRQRCKSPLQAAMESSRLMWESFGKLREEVEKLEKHASPAPLGRNSLRLISNAGLDQDIVTEPSKQAGQAMQASPARENLAKVIPFRDSGKPAH